MAESLALPASDIRRLRFRVRWTGPFVSWRFPHRFLAPARMLAIRLALSLLFRFAATPTEISAGEPSSWLSSFSNETIFSLRSAARRSCCGVKLVIEFITVRVASPRMGSQAAETIRPVTYSC